MNLTYVKAQLDKVSVMIDGLNDFLWGMNGLVKTIVNLVVDQLRIVFEGALEKLIPLINDLIRWIPDSIPIPGTLLHFDMALAKSPWSKEATYMELPLSISLQSDLYPYTEPNPTDFDRIQYDPKYYIQMVLSQYFIDNFFYELHKNGLIVIDTGDLLNTTLFVGSINSSAGLSGTFEGFNTSAPCKVVLTSMDPYPQF